MSGGYFKHDFVNESGSLDELYTKKSKSIGEGSYGTVFLATRKDSGKEHAVKQIAKSKVRDKARLDNEITIQRSLDHPNIVKLYAVMQDDKNLFLCMEKCDGGELFDRIIEAAESSDADMAFDERRASTYMEQIIGAMCYLHSKGFAHRDIKPENFLMENKTPAAQIKVIDFGLGKKFEKGVPMVTKAGTPYYVAPQVLQGKYDEKCDVWSCGVICYILLSGVPPFYGETDGQILSAVKKGKYDFPSPEWDNVSAIGKKIIEEMLTMDPAKRPSFEALSSHAWLTEHAEKQAGIKNKMLAGNLTKFCQANKVKKLALTCVAQQLSDDQIKDLKATFQTLDKNKDGTLTMAELIDGMKKHLELSEEQAKILAENSKNLDTDGSGSIDYTEFIAATIEKNNITSDACIRAAFNVIDLDGDGQITNEELRKQIQDSGEDEILKMIKEFDADGDGKISFEEFKAMIKS